MNSPIRTLAEVERDVILQAISYYCGNRTQTAKALGISIRTLRNRLDKYRGDGSPIPPAAEPWGNPAKRAHSCDVQGCAVCDPTFGL